MHLKSTALKTTVWLKSASTMNDSLYNNPLWYVVQLMTLSSISTPVLRAEAEGRLKFGSPHCVIPVLSVLQHRHP